MKFSSSALARVRLGLGISVLAIAATPHAADHLVTMTSSWTFSPSSIEIAIGDTVTWRNRDDFDDHDASSTLATSLWTTGFIAADESATVQFSTAGTFPYRDSVYGLIGMTGTIVVKGGGSVIPTPVTLTNAMLLPDGAFRFTMTNLTLGLATVVEFSTNLVNWDGLETNFPASNSIEYTNAAAGLFSRSFYRCYQVP